MKKYLLPLLLLTQIGFAQENRTIDASNNNLQHTEWGSAKGEVQTVCPLDFPDNIGTTPAGMNLPSPRLISNVIFNQTKSRQNAHNISDFCWLWGQFIDHDINLIPNSGEQMPIAVPLCDAVFDPFCNGVSIIPFRRSQYMEGTGLSVQNPRVFMNNITAYLDASNVYGSDATRAAWLRTFQDGKLKTSEENLLPFNTIDGKFFSPVDANAPIMDGAEMGLVKYFVAGDVRANEQPSLASMHTLFMREHNRLCDEIKSQHPNWNDEQIYQRARKMVGAMIQVITFEEFLPTLGVEIKPYEAYLPQMNAAAFNVFSAAAFRLGHTMVNEKLLRLSENGDTLSEGNVYIKDAFFNPTILQNEGGIEPFFRGMLVQAQQDIDVFVVNDLRNFLFGEPGNGGMDLVAINIQRGRDRGLSEYNTIRTDFGMSAYNSYQELTDNIWLQNALASIYGDIDHVDLWVGLLAEKHLNNKPIGQLLAYILKKQFEALRDGDRFWYENDASFSPTEKDLLKNTQLSDILLRNTSMQSVPGDVFHINTPVGLSEQADLPLANITALPNPFTTNLTIKVDASIAEKVQLQLLQLDGKVFHSQAVNLVQGENYLSLDAAFENMPQGYYFLQLLGTQQQFIPTKLLKVN
ncbi:MAG: peroxidase family protein [Bacteroidetes bacterium]|nr:peroxidase family protein [Bacteroidota bacterium]MCB9042620.1 peroxidase family protein [Chitinophagales bacterium]